jgi:putative pyruvate formate lyase activating enzyme
MICTLCPRECRVDRDKKLGFCQMPSETMVAYFGLHKWEEPCISGKNGAGTIFFSGCSLRCVFCQNSAIIGKNIGEVYDSRRLVDLMLELQARGAHNIDLVTPTHFADNIASALSMAKASGELKIPVVYNCGGYEKTETLKKLSGLVDVYMPDFKYFSRELAFRYSSAPDYFEVVCSALKEMYAQVGGLRYDGEGILQRGMIIRHLVLPGCRLDSIKILDAIAELLPIDDIILSIMSQYTPEFANTCTFPNLKRNLTTFEYESVLKHAENLGFIGYMQGRDSANTEYTPKF